MMFWMNVGFDWWGKGRRWWLETAPKYLPHNSSYFIFIANDGKERWRKGEAEGKWNSHSKRIMKD